MKSLTKTLSFGVIITGLTMLAPALSFGGLVFSDTFGSGSTLNTGTADPTANSAAYQNWTQGAAPANTSIASGALHFEARNTSSVFSELQGLFTTTPVTLTTVGDYIDLTLTFTDTSHVLLSADNASSQIDIGLYNSGGTKPLPGSRLDAGTASTGGTAGWVGYIGRTFLNGNANTITRPVQSGGATSVDQDLLFNNAGTGAFNSPTGTQLGGTAATGFTSGLTQGNQYTFDYRITLTGAGTLSVSNALYSGSSVAGTALMTQMAAASGGTYLTNAFDGLAFGWRHTGATTSSALDINSITINDLIQSVVPEPTTFALAGFGILGLALARRKQR